MAIDASQKPWPNPVILFLQQPGRDKRRGSQKSAAKRAVQSLAPIVVKAGLAETQWVCNFRFLLSQNPITYMTARSQRNTTGEGGLGGGGVSTSHKQPRRNRGAIDDRLLTNSPSAERLAPTRCPRSAQCRGWADTWLLPHLARLGIRLKNKKKNLWWWNDILTLYKQKESTPEKNCINIRPHCFRGGKCALNFFPYNIVFSSR